MTTPQSENSGFPIWLVAVVGGGLVGLVAGAIIFFGGGSEPKAESPTAAVAPATPPGKTQSVSSSGSGKSLPKMPASVAEWNRLIDEADPDGYAALMDTALMIADPSERQQVAQRLMTKWINSDASGYLDYMDDLEASDNAGENAWPVLVPAFFASLQNASEEASVDPDLEEGVLWMMEYYSEQDPAAAVAWAKNSLVGEVQEEALSTAVGELSVISLDQAVAVAREIKDPNARMDALANIGAVLGDQKPTEALNWAQSLTDEEERRSVLDEVLWSMSSVDPEMAAQELSKTNDPQLIESVGSAVAEELAAKDPMKAVQWAAGIAAGPARDEAMAGALAGWATVDAKAAYEYLRANDRGNGDATEWVFEEWGSVAPEDAVAALTSIPDAEARERAVTGLVNGWLYEEDTQGVENWVDKLPAGREKDIASAAIVDALSFDDPQPAWDRALTISDPQIRQEAVLSAFSGLVDTDEAAAREALKAPQLSAEDRELLSPLMDDSSTGPAPVAVPPAAAN